MIEIDGSHGEGGGQILRTAVSLSAVTGKACKITNIRAGRPSPGLQAQHLTVVNAVASICGAHVKAKLGDTSLVFEPHGIRGGQYHLDIGTAGAISLVIQSLALPALHAKETVHLRITGGTHVKWSPTMDYMDHVFAYYMKRLGIDFHIRTDRCGFYPKGGGVVHVKIEPGQPKPLSIDDRGKLVGAEIFSLASEDLKGAEVAERQLSGADHFMRFDKKAVSYTSSDSPGSAVHAQAKYENCMLGASSVGEPKLKAQLVGETAAHELKKYMDGGACVDDHMADQLLPFLALASGSSAFKAEMTEHARANMWVIEQFLPAKFFHEKGMLSVKV